MTTIEEKRDPSQQVFDYIKLWAWSAARRYGFAAIPRQSAPPSRHVLGPECRFFPVFLCASSATSAPLW